MSTYLIHYGELGLKGNNRRDFENKLRKNILEKILPLDPKSALEIRHKYFVLKTITRKDLTQAIAQVFGIKWFAKATTLPRAKTVKDLGAKAIKLIDPEIPTFKISCKRADKTYPTISPEVEKQVGEVVLKKFKKLKVDLFNPLQEIRIEINTDAIFIYAKKEKGAGGLPVGTSGRVLVLLSGGIDSPVAAYMMAKRGCRVDFLNFYVTKNDDKIKRLAEKLRDYTGPSSRLYFAPYVYFSTEVLNLNTEFELVLFRRFMLKVAEEICHRHHIAAIVSGDNLGQVASQTLENLVATEDALTDIPCFRPLIGLDKDEIIDIAKKISTFDISNEPHKDCCSLIDRHARTRVTVEKIKEEEVKIADYQGLLDKTLEGMEFPQKVKGPVIKPIQEPTPESKKPLKFGRI